MSIISFQPHTLFTENKKNQSATQGQMDESHSSIQGAAGGKGVSAEEENHVSGASVGRGEFSNQEEHNSQEVISHPASEQSLNVDKKQFLNYKFKTIAPIGGHPINYDHAAEKDFKIHEKRLNEQNNIPPKSSVNQIELELDSPTQTTSGIDITPQVLEQDKNESENPTEESAFTNQINKIQNQHQRSNT